MSFFLLLVAVCAVGPVASNLNTTYREWDLYKTEYNKVYALPEEDAYRMRIFAEHRLMVLEHNAKYIKGEVGYKLKVNYFSDMTSEEVSKIFANSYRSPSLTEAETRSPETVYIPDQQEDIPKEIDWFKKGAVTRVRNQRRCGSYAFAAVGSIESRYFIRHHKLVDLSSEQVIDCSIPWGNFACHGGYTSKTFRYVRDVGLKKERSYMRRNDHVCRFKSGTQDVNITSYMIVQPNNEVDLKYAVAKGPVTVAVNAASPKFHHYFGGVYRQPDCDPSKLTHHMLAVGYGKDRTTGEEFWLLKNSWTTRWGEHGYMRIARNANNMCGVASEPMFPTL